MIKKKNKSNILFNKKVKFNFFIKKKFIAGIVLHGWEVKSIRQGKININNSYVVLRSNEIFLLNCDIQPLQTSNFFKNNSVKNHRNIKLLLLKKEINFISQQINKYKYTIVPISLFWKKSFCKLEIGLVIGKSLYDKRQSKKNKILKRELSKTFKRFQC
ncbi:SsrA-binding protein SmpB [Buchnera aphidicola]|uniref:SsrA-binding protein SmpB n=1 Tax=Buchnera aphidicola TaxID=9 RepID=UPI002237EBB6|nr:SsrA-binding protein SmpB [Buchnera aphidicola]MCW5197670.1 SsrA-binding protein SmpB [Buchnera aphidicola (Chaitophorus viminalis)]